jgi:hypothetical protein
MRCMLLQNFSSFGWFWLHFEMNAKGKQRIAMLATPRMRKEGGRPAWQQRIPPNECITREESLRDQGDHRPCEDCRGPR